MSHAALCLQVYSRGAVCPDDRQHGRSTPNARVWQHRPQADFGRLHVGGRCSSPPLPWWRRWLGIGCGRWCSEWRTINSATSSFLFCFRLPTLARSFAQTMQKAKIVWLAVVTTLARLGLQGAGLGVFCIFPADVGDAKGLFAACRRVAAHIFVVHTIVAKIGAIAGRSDELGDVALDNPCTVTAVCGFQDPYGIEGLFLLCSDTAYLRTKDHEDD